uniref:Carboxypeptidase n=1 Tax=Helicoverpa armigera TaxID=29058 RepID=B1NLE5_HELAM|nr:carboxypeptidase [Helicoverpa armigera]
MKFIALATLLVLANAKHEEYIGWKSYYVGASTQEQVKSLIDLGDKLDLDFLSPAHTHREALVLVQPEHQEEFVKSLESLDIKYMTHTDNVKSALDQEDEVIEEWTRSSARSGFRSMPYNNYQRLDVIYAYMQDIANRFPNTVRLVTAANSFQGRPIRYLRISTTNFEDHSKPVIFIDGGIHSREWISPPTVTWAIRKLTEDVTEPDLLNNYDWILLPVVNPDGYEFTFTNTRFWRKTRSTNTHSSSSICPGVDGNRNYDFAWNTVGTSNSPCSDIYAGDRPFSEVETQVVRDILQEHLARIALYITVHSYGSMILYPWGHDGSLSHNGLGLHTVGVAMANAIDALSLPNFPRYVVGNSALVLNYRAAGAAEDYAHSIGVPLAYTYELPGLSWGNQGFHLDPRYIEQVCRETWAGFVVGARRAAELFKK